MLHSPMVVIYALMYIYTYILKIGKEYVYIEHLTMKESILKINIKIDTQKCRLGLFI